MSSERPLGHERLCLFFDGTWNQPEAHTNVWRLYLMLAERGRDGVPQRAFYEEGVGINWYDHLLGGAFGRGVSQNIRRGYRWLMEHYNPGDEIFLFGFSRGAFTARSLAGLIARCGILKPEAPMSFAQLYERYARGDEVDPIYQLDYDRRHGNRRDFDFEERVLLDHSHYRPNMIKMIGVWDTVGSLGVPGNRRSKKYHNTHLSTVIEHSYQALALDEHRQPYWAILWTTFSPEGANPATTIDGRTVEQRWFSGAHANVGGGYQSDLLPQRPLKWIQDKAVDCGIHFRSTITIDDLDLEMRETDSYRRFLGGWWRFMKPVKYCRPYTRWIMSDAISKPARQSGKIDRPAGSVRTVNERIDESVFLRCRKYKDYRPASLLEWAKRKGIDLETLINDPSEYSKYTSPVRVCGIDDIASSSASGSALVAGSKR